MDNLHSISLPTYNGDAAKLKRCGDHLLDVPLWLDKTTPAQCPRCQQWLVLVWDVYAKSVPVPATTSTPEYRVQCVTLVYEQVRAVSPAAARQYLGLDPQHPCEAVSDRVGGLVLYRFQISR